MAQSVTLWGASYSDVPAIDVPKTGGGTATFTDTTPTTASASDVMQGKYFFTASGVLTLGTAHEGGDVPVWQGSDDYVYFSDTVTPPYEIVMVDGYVVIDLPPAVLNLQTKTKTYTPTASQQTEQITADQGYDGLEEVDVTVNAIPQGDYDIDVVQTAFYTEDNVRKWRTRANMDVWNGWLPPDSYYGAYLVRNAVPTNTTVTPSTSSQTVGGANYVMEGAVTVNPIPSQYIIPSGTLNVTSSGTKDVTNYASASVPSLTLPSSTSPTGSGTQKAQISSSTGFNYSYLNIPAGFNDTAQNYLINPVPLDTLSVTSNGTYNPADYDCAGFSSVSVNVSGGLVYETGTWTPTADVSTGSISFANTHTTAPFYYMVIDAEGDYTGTTYTNIGVVYTDWSQALGCSFYASASNIYEASANIMYRGSGTALTTGNYWFTPDYSRGNWVSNTELKPQTNSTSRYWKAGRTYKWIAVWTS